MIRICDAMDLDDAIDYAWSHQSNPLTQSFPKYKTKSELSKIIKKSLCLAKFNDHQEIVGFGAFAIAEDDCIMQTVAGIYASNDYQAVLRAFIDYLKAAFPSYQLLCGFPISNQTALEAYDDFDANLIDDCTVMTLDVERIPKLKHATLHMEPLLESNEQRFKHHHDQVNPDIFWSADKIFRNKKPWFVFLEMSNQSVVGSITLKKYNHIYAEVFSFYSSMESAYEFLNRSVRYCADQGIEEILFFVDTENAIALAAATANGFREQDHYFSFKISL
ncbi:MULTISPECIES: acyl-CoA acyltransferase [unclassified Erysipelothrix]|uniref:acyl-CoA acyltransferase n=1 Tax=unclassified Erysipelothrix TaxID=2624170 RepID=UPI001377A443|nr:MULTISPECIES: acyl-CoA acyltransferase [unclassified Erysipelothrix]MBK2402534.1 acyl-CoA acyltransferase [Erysipelothrix sp. strain 2 (EsS2-6-Brazil)]MBK2403481.1 acyl-CoA acyltransferase [Erysipelothrix sp. strain 2 (EsS2-7-Brazil)]NBA01527.1 acyl-CoA acyltransferase [Erysipelothrix rhusiopathiae]